MEREDKVVAVLAAAGGSVIGRVRLQKSVYLLERLGLNSGFRFAYHHYGPFSRDLDNAMADAKAFGLVKEEFRRRESDGAIYSAFTLQPEASVDPRAYGTLGQERTAALVNRFAETNVTVLELAATVHWLAEAEHVPDWPAEIRKRKGVKVKEGRLEQAVDLLTELHLAPPVAAV